MVRVTSFSVKLKSKFSSVSINIWGLGGKMVRDALVSGVAPGIPYKLEEFFIVDSNSAFV